MARAERAVFMAISGIRSAVWEPVHGTEGAPNGCLAWQNAKVPVVTDMDAMKAKIILYVEDDPVVLMAYRYRLERVGYAVESARDGLEAMKVLARLVPDLVVLDLMMPRFDGTEVLKYMQADSRLKTVPVVILSTNSITDAAEEYVLEGACRRFLKDKCTFPVLLRAITELLGKSPATADGAPAKPVASGPSGKLEKTSA